LTQVEKKVKHPPNIAKNNIKLFFKLASFFYNVLLNFIEDQHKEGQQLIYSEGPVEEKNKNNLQNKKKTVTFMKLRKHKTLLTTK